MKLNYKNITVSGLPGAGSSTLGKALAHLLNFKYFSGGDFMRQYAIEQGLFDPKTKTHHPATVYSDDFDRKVDYGMRRTLSKKSGYILDSWLSGFMAQGIKTNLKVLVFCSNDKIRVDRIANRDNITIQEAKQHVFEREEKNVSKWQKMYQKEWEEWVIKPKKINVSKKVWYWYPELYDLSIDTYKYSKQETLGKVLKTLGYQNKVDYHQVFVSI